VDVNEAGEQVYNVARRLSQETSVEFTGKVIEDQRQIGGVEVHVTNIKVIHKSENYPITNKPHGIDFLLDNRHLWLRHRRPWAIMRIRNTIIFAIHKFFQQEGFIQGDAPIFTPNAVEGTTTLFETDFYDRKAYLTQSGQLYGEAMALALGKIYTFGPTFRAEKSKTRRHLSEFWMIEPEMAFYDNEMNMDLIERFIKFIVSQVLEKNKFELSLLERDLTILENTVNKPFPRITYDEAVAIIRGEKDVNGKTNIGLLEEKKKATEDRIELLKKEISEREKILSDPNLKEGKRNFIQNKVDTMKHELKELQEKLKNIPQWIESAKNFEYGEDFGGSDETALTSLFDTPVMVYNWPKKIKAFYMKEVPGRPDLVKGVDVLAPEGYGEIVGGSERETDLNILIDAINKHGLPMKIFEWYLDLRRFGSVPHSGFGLGLERFVAWITKTKHIRETIPFPRMYGRIEP
jgi:asparaginyl-tRNA synthetase